MGEVDADERRQSRRGGASGDEAWAGLIGKKGKKFGADQPHGSSVRMCG